MLKILVTPPAVVEKIVAVARGSAMNIEARTVLYNASSVMEEFLFVLTVSQKC